MPRYVPLICLALMHTLVDTSALLIEPLWPQLKQIFGLEAVAMMSAAFVIQSLPTSISQAVFGYFRDRRTLPFILWLGPALAVICLTMIGSTRSLWLLCPLLLLGGIGVGAFHPEAAVAAGRALPENRTRGVSLFMFGGSLGLALGPSLGGIVVHRWGLEGLLRLTLPLLLVVPVLWQIGRLGSLVETRHATVAASGLSSKFDGRLGFAFLLLCVCSLRLVPNMAMNKVLSFALAARGAGPDVIGYHQALFLMSASAGMFVMAFRFRAGWERGFMIWCPLLGIPLLLLLAWSGTSPGLLTLSLIPAGLVMWGTSPAMVSYAQQQFPNGAGLASAITLGVSWGLGGLIQAPITAWFESQGTPLRALYAFIPCLLLSSLGAAWMSRSERRKSESSGESLSAQADLPTSAVPQPAEA